MPDEPNVALVEVGADTFSFADLLDTDSILNPRRLALALINSVASHPPELRRKLTMKSFLRFGQALIGSDERSSSDLDSIGIAADQWLEARATRYTFNIDVHASKGDGDDAAVDWHSRIASHYFDRLSGQPLAEQRQALDTPSLYCIADLTNEDMVVGMFGDTALKGLRPCLLSVRFSRPVSKKTVRGSAWLLVHWLASTYIRSDRERCRQEQLTRYLTTPFPRSDGELVSPLDVIASIRTVLSEDLKKSLLPLETREASVYASESDRSCLWQIGTTVHPVESRVERGPTLDAMSLKRLDTMVWNGRRFRDEHTKRHPVMQDDPRLARDTEQAIGGATKEQAIEDALNERQAIEDETDKERHSIDDHVAQRARADQARRRPVLLTLTLGDLPPQLQVPRGYDSSKETLPLVLRCEGWATDHHWKDLEQRSDDLHEISTSREEKLRNVVHRIESNVGRLAATLFSQWRESVVLDAAAALGRGTGTVALCRMLRQRLGAQTVAIVHHAPPIVNLRSQLLGEFADAPEFRLRDDLADLSVDELGKVVVWTPVLARRRFLPPMVQNAAWCSRQTQDRGSVTLFVGNVRSPLAHARSEPFIPREIQNYSIEAVDSLSLLLANLSANLQVSWWASFVRLALGGEPTLDGKMVARVVRRLEGDHGGNTSKMAVALGVKRTTLHQQLKRLEQRFPEVQSPK